MLELSLAVALAPLLVALLRLIGGAQHVEQSPQHRANRFWLARRVGR